LPGELHESELISIDISFESSKDELPISSFLSTDYFEVFQFGLLRGFFNSSMMF